jgi:single-strand DNA-binding protein
MKTNNSVSLTGRLTRDAEINTSRNNGKPYCRFTLAVNDYNPSGEQQASFFNCVTFGDATRYMSNARKGELITVEGKLQQSRYIDKDGREANSVSVIAFMVTADNDSNDRGYSDRGMGTQRDTGYTQQDTGYSDRGNDRRYNNGDKGDDRRYNNGNNGEGYYNYKPEDDGILF